MVYLGIGVLWLLHWLPLPLLALVGGALGELLFAVASRRRRIALTNLRLCFPERAEGERRRIARAHFRLMATAFLEQGVLWWAPRWRIRHLTRFRNLELWRAHAEEPVIMLAPHFVGLDWGAQCISVNGYRGVTMYSNQKQQLLTRLLVRARTRFSPNLLYSRQDGIKPILRALKQGIFFYYLPDQDLGPRESIFVPFFGIPTATIPALHRLARAAQARVIPCITRRLSWGRGYETTFYPAWDGFPSANIAADTRRMNAFIEERILEMPEQYFWMHRRFKTRPPGEASLYPGSDGN